MKKFLFVVIALALVFGVSADCSAAGTKYPAYNNAIIIDGNGQVNEPPMMIKRVRYGVEGLSTSGLSSGDVVTWDITSKDAVTVSMLIGSVTTNVSGVAGVLVTDLLTQDVGGTGDILDDNYGYMCVQGYCMANVDDSACTEGGPLVPASALNGAFATQDKVALSNDAGILLENPGSDTKVRVWLR